MSTALLGLLVLHGIVPAKLDVRAMLKQALSAAGRRPVVLFFIAHDCPICNSYAPEIARIARQYEGRATVELVYSEPRATPAMAKQHAKEYSLSGLPRVLDPSHSLAKALTVSVTPEAVVIDQAGKLQYAGRIDNRFPTLGVQRTAVTVYDLRGAIDSVLAHKPVKPAAGPAVGCIISSP